MKGFSEYKASESNIRRIQVKDIVKEVKDYLKTYSSAGMDISWYVEEYAEVLRKVRGGNTLTILLPFQEEQAELKLFSEVFSPWMAFGGNTHDLGSFKEEADEITDLHQIHEEILFLERGDGVAGIKRRRRDPSIDNIRYLVTASRRGRLNEDLESST
ncbi:hypothetical protein Tco_0627730 [Tanacetum coccineum]|uniref:Uncharacterized protein n=1 Tax=Tanacetum coccineum TaxID=301880 RepID=A0ABQ4WNJ1_9ASTR